MKILTFILAAALSLNYSFAQSGKASISGKYQHLTDADTVTILIYKYGNYTSESNDFARKYRVPVNNHGFEFKINIRSNTAYEGALLIPGIKPGQPGHLGMFVIEPGDHLRIADHSPLLSPFAGTGAMASNLFTRLTQMSINDRTKRFREKKMTAKFEMDKGCVAAYARYLRGYRPKLSEPAYNLLNVLAQSPIFNFYYDIYRGNGHVDSVARFLKAEWLPFRNQYFISPDSNTITNSGWATELLYQDYIIKHSIDSNTVDPDSNRGLFNAYNFFKTNYWGIVRQVMLTNVLINNGAKSDHLDYFLKDSKNYVRNTELKKALIHHLQCIPGNPAYNFALLDTNKTIHRLSDYKGKVVVLDFWFTYCGNCIRLTPKLREVENQFKNDERVVFIAINSDEKYDTWKQSIKGGLYTTSNDEINLYTAGRGLKDPIFEKTNFQGAPTLRLVDKNGNWLPNPIDCRLDEGQDLKTKIEKALNM